MNKLKAITFFMALFLLSSQSFAEAVTKSTIDDQKSVEVTVYNNNLGLIKDIRSIKLPKGVSELRFMDVSAYIQPETVVAKSLNKQHKFMVLEQNYEYDLMNPQKLLDKFVGKEVKLVKENHYTGKKSVVTAKLLSNNGGQPIYEIDGEIHIYGTAGAPILSEIPDNLIAQPTLMWMINNDSARSNDIEVSYLTNSLSWKADYVLTVGKEDKLGDITGWVTIDNNSGTTYNNASLKLVAGEVNVARDRNLGYLADRMLAKSPMAFEESSGFVEKGFFEYHIYDLQRPTTLKDKQKKQINLLDAQGFDITKQFKVYGLGNYWHYRYKPQTPKIPVNVYMNFENSKENKLGMPIPKGIIRLYKEDDEGKLQFIGSDNVDHTPKDEEISVKVGEAFDIVAERKQTDYRLIANSVHESEWEIILKNHKEEDIVVSVIEPLYGSWQVISTTHQHQKIDAFTLQFDIPVAKDEEVKLKYRIRVNT